MAPPPHLLDKPRPSAVKTSLAREEGIRASTSHRGGAWWAWVKSSYFLHPLRCPKLCRLRGPVMLTAQMHSTYIMGARVATGGTGEKKTFHVHMLSTYCHFMNALYHKTSAAPKSSDGEPASTWVSGMQSSLKIALPFLVGVGSFVNYRASEHVFEGLPRFIHHWPGFSRIVGQNLRCQFVEDENLTKLFVNIRDCMFAFAYVGIFRP